MTGDPADSRSRDQFLTFIQLRLARFLRWHDPDDLLDDEVRSACTRLLRLVGTETTDLEVVVTVAGVFWIRADLESGQQSEDLAVAVSLWRAVNLVAPDMVPPEPRSIIEIMEQPDPRQNLLWIKPEELAHSLAVTFGRAWSEKNVQSITEHIDMLERVLSNVPREHEWWASFAGLLGAMYDGRYSCTESPADLDSAISWGLAGVRATREDQPRSSIDVRMVADALRRRSERGTDPADLNTAVDLSIASIASTPPDDPQRSSRLSFLAGLLIARYNQTKHPIDLDEAVRVSREACDVGDRTAALSALRDSLARRFDKAARPQDIEEVVSLDTHILEQTPVGGWEESTQLLTLVEHRWKRHQLPGLGGYEEFDPVISILRQALNRDSGNRSVRSGRLMLLARVLTDRYLATGLRNDLAQARELLDEAVGLSDQDNNPWHQLVLDSHHTVLSWSSGISPSRADLLARGAADHACTYARSGDLSDLNSAITLGLQAQEATAPGDVEMAPRMLALAENLLRRYYATERDQDVHQALALTQTALGRSPEGALKAAALRTLAGALRAHFELSGKRADLETAIAAAEQSITAAPAQRPGGSASETALADCLIARYHLVGDPQDARRAIAALRAALRDSPADQPKSAIVRWNLGAALLECEYNDDNRSLAVLSEAIDLLEQAIATAGTSKRFRYLGNALLLRYRHTDRSVDLVRSIEAYERALGLMPATDPAQRDLRVILSAARLQLHQRASVVNPFARIEIPHDDPAEDAEGTDWHQQYLRGLYFMDRHLITHDPVDLARAVEFSRQAVASVPAGHDSERILLAQLGNQMVATGEEPHIIESVSLFRRLLQSVPDDSVALSSYQFFLADSLRAHCKVTDSSINYAEAVNLFFRVAQTQSAPPPLRSDCARIGGRFCASRQDWGPAADLLEHAVSALSQVASPTLSPEDQQYELTRRAGLVGDAAACALALGDGDRAVTVLELGRGIVMSQALNQEPADSPAPLDPATIAADGPVVLLNMSDYRCDALIITPAGVDVLPLQDLDLTTLARYAASIQVAGTNAHNPNLEVAQRHSLQDQTTEILANLWNTIVGPVLDRLGITEAPRDGHWPRMWWIPGTLFAWLPLHAAGHHNKHSNASAPTALDRVVSSYAPTLRALLLARHRAAQRMTAKNRLLVVSMPELPGHPELTLPGAQQEADLLTQRFPDARVLGTCSGAAAPATPENILSALPQHVIAHFACHTQDDWIYPSRSRLVVEPGERHPPTVQDISALNLEGAQLAFLSSCATARTPAFKLLDEALNLAAAFQLAGYPHVIGTLWPINDGIAADFTEDYYARISTSPPRLDISSSAQAVHQATLTLRKRFPAVPTMWAAHIHIGP